MEGHGRADVPIVRVRGGVGFAVNSFAFGLGLGLGLGFGLGLSELGDIRGCCLYSSVVERDGRGATSGLRLEGRVCCMLTVMLGGGSGLGLC